jgi:hypothetical protein
LMFIDILTGLTWFAVDARPQKDGAIKANEQHK